MHVIETVLIGLVMVSAVSFVITFSAPTNVSEPTRQRLDAQAGDALKVLDEFPNNDPRFGNNTLSKLVFECLQNKCSNLTTRLNGLLPDATSYTLYVNNGYAYLPVYEPKLPAGESVNVRHPLEPRLTYVWMQTATEEVAPSLKTTLGVFALPVYNSNILLDGGTGLEVRVQGYNNANLRSFNLTAYYSTQEGVSGSSLSSPTVLLYKPSGEPGLFLDRTGSANTSLWLEVKETAGNPVRKGTTINITAPRGFTLSMWQGGTDVASWNAATTVGAATGGMSLMTSLKQDLAGGSAVRFRVNATPVIATPVGPDAYDFYSFNVRLGNGAYSVADLILKYRSSATATGGDFHSIVASVPKPMGSTGSARYAVAVQSPVLPNPAEDITITRIEFLQPDGLPIFSGTPTAVGSVHGGSWKVGAGGASSSLAWGGAKRMLPGEALDMVVDVTGAGTLTPAVPREHQVAAIRTPTSTTQFTREVGPGLFYGEIPRDERVVAGTLTGYFWPPVGGQANIGLYSDVRPVSQRSTVLPGTWNYDVASVATLRDSLSLINVTLSQRVVPIGDKVTIDVDASNLLLNLSERGIEAKTRIKLYPSWALDSHTTIRDNETTERSIFESATSHLLLHDFTKDGVKDILVATEDGGVYVLNGKNGYKVPGLSAKLANGKVTSMAVGYLEVADVAKAHPYVLIGSEASGTGVNLYVLDSGLNEVWASRVSLAGAGAQNVVSADVVPDVDGTADPNGAYWHDIAVGDAAGSWFYVSGASGVTIATTPAIGAPPPTGALVTAGKWGSGKVDGVVATTGVTVTVLNNFALDASTLGGVHDTAKRANVNIYDGGLMAVDRSMKTIWSYGDDVALYRVLDLDGDGTSDVVAASADGNLAALNGTQAAMPYNGITYTVGTTIVDGASLPGDPYRVWTVSNDGIAMYSNDGMTTRWYASDVPTAAIGGAYYSVPGARAIAMANKDVGWIVGDDGKLWTTTDGSSDDGPAVWTPGTLSVASRSESTALWDFKDVAALGPATAVAVGECGGTCTGAVAFRYDGGVWTEALGFGATDKITRLHFYNATDGWAVADTPTGIFVYRTVDGGRSWVKPLVAIGAVNAVAFRDASNGVAVGPAGLLKVSTNGGVSWTVPSVSLGTSQDLNDIQFADALNGVIVGNAGTIFRTYDGGATWVRLAGDATTHYTRAPYPAAMQGYILGGPVAGGGRYVGMMATYSSYSFATSKTDFSPAAAAEWVTITPTTRNLDGYTDVRYNVSPNGGATWYPVVKKSAGADVLHSADYWPVNVSATPGTNMMVKMELVTDSSFPYVSPEVEDVTMEVSYKQAGVNTTIGLRAKFATDGAVEPGSTAIWDAAAAGVRSPRLTTFWSRQLPGAVVSMDVGRAVTTASHNDARTDVLVGMDSADRRVLAISGANGGILWATAPFPAGSTVKAVGFIDQPGRTADAFVDAAAVVETTGLPEPSCPGNPTTVARVYFINGYDGSSIGSPYPLCSGWRGFGVADLSSDGNTDVVVGQVGNVASSAGYVHAVDGKNGAKLWRTVPSIKGFYTLEYEAPLNAIFGPYIVEVEVSGTQTIGGVSVSLVTRSVTYFLVTPPNRQMPVSPVYTVELVAWYDDWDFAPGATKVEVLPPLPSNPSWPIFDHPTMREHDIR